MDLDLEEFRASCDRRDLLALQALGPLSSSYLPWTVSAMRPSGVTAVLNDIVVNRRRRVVELGGGVSTLYIGRLLLGGDGRLWTVEHDERWADFLEHQVAGEGLDEVVTVVRAPLAPMDAGWPGEDARWYDRDRLRAAVGDQRVDLLVVDGPPAFQAGRNHARYPAVPFFAPTLADDYTVVLDDIDRFGEQDIVESWERALGVRFERRLVDGRIAVGRSRAAYSV